MGAFPERQPFDSDEREGICERAQTAISLISPVYQTAIPLNSLGYTNIQTDQLRKIYQQRGQPQEIGELENRGQVLYPSTNGGLLVTSLKELEDFLIEGSVVVQLDLPEGSNPYLLLLKKSDPQNDLTRQEISQKQLINTRVTVLAKEPKKIIRVGGRKGKTLKQLFSTGTYEIWGEIHNLNTEEKRSSEKVRTLKARICSSIT
jgi:hypothetical protein